MLTSCGGDLGLPNSNLGSQTPSWNVRDFISILETAFGCQTFPSTVIWWFGLSDAKFGCQILACAVSCCDDVACAVSGCHTVVCVAPGCQKVLLSLCFFLD